MAERARLLLDEIDDDPVGQSSRNGARGRFGDIADADCLNRAVRQHGGNDKRKGRERAQQSRAAIGGRSDHQAGA